MLKFVRKKYPRRFMCDVEVGDTFLCDDALYMKARCEPSDSGLPRAVQLVGPVPGLLRVFSENMTVSEIHCEIHEIDKPE